MNHESHAIGKAHGSVLNRAVVYSKLQHASPICFSMHTISIDASPSVGAAGMVPTHMCTKERVTFKHCPVVMQWSRLWRHLVRVGLRDWT